MRRVRMAFFALGLVAAAPAWPGPLPCEAFENLAARHLCDRANNGDPEAAAALADRLDGDDDGREVLQLYRRMAAAGDPRGLFGLAQLHRDGTLLPHDQRTALRLLHAAAELGLVEAERELARIYERGLEADLDLPEAARWYARAAAQGDAESLLKLAQARPGD